MRDLQSVFTELRAVLLPYAARLDVQTDTASSLSLHTRHLLKNKKPLFFGAVRRKKNYVSFHLMPLYVKPDLLTGVSPRLKARMHGKSCFNFNCIDRPLFKELAALARAAFASYKQQGFV